MGRRNTKPINSRLRKSTTVAFFYKPRGQRWPLIALLSLRVSLHCRNSVESVWALINITLRNISHAKFYTSKQVIQKMIHIFPLYFNSSNPGHPGEYPVLALGPLFEQTRLRTTRLCYISNFKQLSPQKTILKYILLANQDPLV